MNWNIFLVKFLSRYFQFSSLSFLHNNVFNVISKIIIIILINIKIKITFYEKKIFVLFHELILSKQLRNNETYAGFSNCTINDYVNKMVVAIITSIHLIKKIMRLKTESQHLRVALKRWHNRGVLQLIQHVCIPVYFSVFHSASNATTEIRGIKAS